MTDKRDDVVLRVMPRIAHINANGHIFGGWVLSQMDIAGGIVAHRIAQGAVATVAIESMKSSRRFCWAMSCQSMPMRSGAGGPRSPSASMWWRRAGRSRSRSI